MAVEQTQVLVIGGGPGGYVTAIRAAQLGFKVTVVEKQYYGGTCLNVGCIPSKALLEDSNRFAELKHLGGRGINVGEVSLDWPVMQQRKDRVVTELVKGVKLLLDKNNIATIDGAAAFTDPHTVAVTTAEGERTITAEHIIIATGSVPSSIPPITIDNETVWDSTGALNAQRIPETLAVIGGGYIGMELASVYRRLGSDVHIIEMLPAIMPGFDPELVKEATRAFKKQKFTLHTGRTLAEAEHYEGDWHLTITDEAGQTSELTATHVLVSVGRRPYTNGLNLEAAGLSTNERGFIAVDANLRTAQPHIYAIGDVTGGMMLAHKASYEGECAAELIAGHTPDLAKPIPAVVFTTPQLACVGLTDGEAREQGYEVLAGRFAFRANGYAKALGEVDGMVKWVADAKTDRLLGCHIVGPHAGELIHEATLALTLKAKAKDVQHMIHGHPTLSEALHEAVLSLDGRAIHALN